MKGSLRRGVAVLLALTLLGGSASPVSAADTVTDENSVSVSAEESGEEMDGWDEANETIDKEIEEGDYDDETAVVSDDEDTYVDAFENTDTDSYVYLSDLDYMSNSSQGWSGKTIMKDKNYSGGNISLMIEGEKVYFPKGIEAHANSNVYYDLGENHDYKRLLTYAGIDTSVTGGDGVQMWVYVSNDAKDWTGLWTDENRNHVYMSTDNALYMDVDISGYRYLRLQAYQIKSNSCDHATWADAKLVKANYSEEEIDVPTVAELDAKIAKLNKTSSEEYQKLVLQRTLINNVGVMTLKKTIEANAYVKKAYNWLLSDEDNLEMYILGGAPTGTYIKSLEVMGELLSAHKKDLSDKTYGSTYKTMLIALSLTHSTTVRFWLSDKAGTNDDGSDTSGENSKNISDPVKRYELFKKMMGLNKLHSTFYTLTVEEMRLVMNNKLSDEEIEWLNDYSYSRSGNQYLRYNEGWVKYINQTYRWHNDIYYDSSTIEDYSATYGNFLDYGVTMERYNPSLWMVFDSWGVCWHISNTFTNVVQSQGVPCLTLGQPNHVNYVYFEDPGTGTTKYVPHNSASGWWQTNFTTYTGDKGYYVNRPYMNWGVGSYTQTTKYNASYLWLAQKALDDYDNYSESEKLVLSAESYANNPAQQAKLYEQAISTCKYNFNAYLNLAYLYRDNPTLVKDSKRYELAAQIVDNLGNNPLPVNDLWLILNAQITDSVSKMQMSILRSNAVAAWQNSGSSEIKAIVSYISGDAVDQSIATFSFDGDNAGKIVLTENYQGLGVNWNYSLDGGKTWSGQTNAHQVALSQKELSSLTEEDGIKVHIIGTDQGNSKNWFSINLTKGVLPSTLYANDLENRVVDATSKMEWSLEASDVWETYDPDTTRFAGNVVIKMRIRANGTTFTSDEKVFQFTDDDDSDTRKYVTTDRLSVDSYSSAYGSDPAKNIINGNINNIWHTLWNGSDKERWIVIKTDTPIYLSAVEYVPRQDSQNGRAKDAVLYVSTDGENWTEVSSVSGWANDKTTKTIELDKPIKAQYVKFQITTGYGGSYGSAAMLNLFEDSTKIDTSVAESKGSKESIVTENSAETGNNTSSGGHTFVTPETSSESKSSESSTSGSNSLLGTILGKLSGKGDTSQTNRPATNESESAESTESGNNEVVETTTAKNGTVTTKTMTVKSDGSFWIKVVKKSKSGKTKTTEKFYCSGKSKKLTLKKVTSNAKSVSIPSTIKMKGTTYKVTAIGKNAFKKNKKLKKITVGKYIKKVGKNAFKKINKNTVIKIKGKAATRKKIKKLIKKSGIKKSVKFKKA